MPDPPHPYVSRAGVKLAAALDAFQIDVRARRCVDLGCNVGGFTDCLLQHGAAAVHAVDTAYGLLAWQLRCHDRVRVHERCNALYAEPSNIPEMGSCDLAVVDLGWTRQALAIPAALRWLKPEPAARIISLIKPHYEAASRGPRRTVLTADEAKATCERVLAALPAVGVRVLACMPSPIRGGKRQKGNVEYLALLAPPPGNL